MSHESDPTRVLDLLAQNESAIGQLYQVYARNYPELAAFWEGLAAEETEHAGWIRALGGKVAEGSLYLSEHRFKEEAIRSFLTYLEDELNRARSEKMPLVTALSVALSIEEALIERKYFEVFETDSAELRHLLQNLARASEEHARRVKDLWSTHGSSQQGKSS